MSKLICFCFRVEKSSIVAAIEGGCATVDALSEKLRVCTGCGGCRPDVEDLIRFCEEERRQVRPPGDPIAARPSLSAPDALPD